MTLLDRSGFLSDAYRRVGVADAAGIASPLVPMAELDQIENGRADLGVEVANTANLESLAPHLGKLALIAIGFPSFGDGRGFTLAKRLRRAGFKGKLRAVGPLIPDQLIYALECGFDEIEIPDANAARQNEQQWLKAADAITDHYQSGYGASSILEHRRLARKEAQHV